jgi:hypothetical protein
LRPRHITAMMQCCLLADHEILLQHKARSQSGESRHSRTCYRDGPVTIDPERTVVSGKLLNFRSVPTGGNFLMQTVALGVAFGGQSQLLSKPMLLKGPTGGRPATVQITKLHMSATVAQNRMKFWRMLCCYNCGGVFQFDICSRVAAFVASKYSRWRTHR